ncbi:hypothetical protein RJ639_041027 [Escallonia herrerae]|uniref:Uncharacterized protein n=1 Tax=Escallonia herrerae TaxID=1293975 RepID=A0AA88WG10_9ASTE|nr:hypothetical protein RJ639_041027 [Escallonia herrerae]
MADWGSVVMTVVLFVLLTPGLLCQIPGKGRVVEFGNMQTSGISILVHTVITLASSPSSSLPSASTSIPDNLNDFPPPLESCGDGEKIKILE